MKTVKDLNVGDYCYSIDRGNVHIYKVLRIITYAPRFPNLYEVKLLDTKTTKTIDFCSIPEESNTFVGYSQIVYFTKDEIIEKINKWISYFNDVKLEIENSNKD